MEQGLQEESRLEEEGLSVSEHASIETGPTRMGGPVFICHNVLGASAEESPQ